MKVYKMDYDELKEIQKHLFSGDRQMNIQKSFQSLSCVQVEISKTLFRPSLAFFEYMHKIFCQRDVFSHIPTKDTPEAAHIVSRALQSVQWGKEPAVQMS